MFSIVIPLYNKQTFLSDTLRSVKAQRFEDFEVIIVDDGSTDQSAEIARNAAQSDPRFKVLEQSNSGVSAARNVGIAKALHEWIAFLDADDIWAETHLNWLSAAARAVPSAGFLSTAFLRDGPLETRLPEEMSKPENRIEQSNYFKWTVSENGYFQTSSIAVRRALFTEVGGFGPYNKGEDVELWARVGLRTTVGIAMSQTVRYTHDPAGLMSSQNVHVRTEDLIDDVMPTPVLETLKGCRKEYVGTEIEKDVTTYMDHRLLLGVRAAIRSGDMRRARKLWRRLNAPFTGKALGHLALSLFPAWVPRVALGVRARLR